MVSAGDVAYYVLLPFAWLLHGLLLVLTTVAAPILLLARAVWQVCLIPVRILYTFETLFYFFGAAILIGAMLGSALHFLGRFAKSALALDHDDRDDKLMQLSWREQLEERKAKRALRPSPRGKLSLELTAPAAGYTGLPQHDKLTPKSPSPMMSTAIHEEEDSSSDAYF